MNVAVIGAGLTGSMVSALLSKLGFEVHIFEKRDPSSNTADAAVLSSKDFGNSTSATKRSINLALSHRGQSALKELGLLDEAMKEAIRMSGRVIHSLSGEITTQAYGKPDEAIWSVDRNMLNRLLIKMLSEEAALTGKVKTYFGYSLIESKRTGMCTFKNPSGKIEEFQFDLVIGADGAYSATRESILKQGRLNFSRDYIAHGYKELTIPGVMKNGKLDYALENVEGLHIWPRGEFMLIALPNPDKSFTATLFAPYACSHGGFDSVDPTNKDQVMKYFEKHFPDVIPIMPSLVEDYKNNPVGSLVTMRLKPWNLGKIVIMGDAAHAVVPFYGQGMNAGFEDALMFYEIVKAKLGKEKLDFEAIGEEFSRKRQPSANALADLCLDHYADMAASTASTLYLMKKKIESAIHWLFPSMFTPLYSMVAFSRTPYHEARQIAERQDEIAGNIAVSTMGLAAAGLGIYGVRSGFFEVAHRLLSTGALMELLCPPKWVQRR